MSYLPCENPSCKSYGRPHPNCRCHGGLAEGGEANFCARDQKHQKGCEYFAEGGEPDFIPDAATPDEPDFVPDSEEPKAEDLPTGEPDFIPDAPESGDENLSLSPADLQAKMVASANPNGQGPYETGGQQLATVAEGAAQGLVGPLAPLAETKIFGVDPADIAGRAEANPVEHGLAEAGAFAGSMALGVGEAKVIASAAAKAAKAAEILRLSEKGAAAVKSAVTMGLMQGSDEVSKAILGQAPPDDAVNPYLATGAMTLFGGAVGYAAAKTAATLIPFEVDEAKKFLAGAGHAAAGGEMPKGADELFRKGYHFLQETVAGRAAEHIGGIIGEKAMGRAGKYAGKVGGRKILQPLLGKSIGRASKYAGPTVIRWLSQGAEGNLGSMLDYASKVAKGETLLGNSIDALFKAGAQQTFDATKEDIDALRGHIGSGGVIDSLQDEMGKPILGEEPEGFAEGGQVKKKDGQSRVHDDHAHVAQNLPEQNHLIQQAKGRVSSYLNSQRPQKHAPKLAFDDDPDDTEQKKNYDKALNIAVQPVSVLGHIKNGTIEPEHIKHLSSMYPELTGHLQKKLTERITQEQLDGKKPDYKVRQGLSMLMGAPLSGELTPESIQAAQATFVNGAKQRQKQTEPAQAPGGSGSKASLSKSEQSYLTDDQARERRQQRG